ncbi:MAG: cytochrome c oxidase accessory protein CcoG [Gammaproteobacteria bacterium RIFCSPLOWO2_12_FULL_52_10]|nr:MAG: cytochrome c oxidase accessory protein CcoG [Gammaproteobacteria bacterium RIFCSPLOWO2_12_FULL_52_10]
MTNDTLVSSTDRPDDQQVEAALFAKREKIYPREVHGLYATLRNTSVIGLLAIYFVLPWVAWDGRQAVLFDLPARKFYIFSLTFWPQDFLNLAFLLIIAALSLFFFTALAGRLWCGYACPQTVWTELFIWVERLLEGNRSQQIRLDKLPRWNRERVRAKLLKHAVWLVIAWYTGFTFLAYFRPAGDLLADMMVFNLGPWETFWLFFYTLATYGNAGWMREQVCMYMCPYARFQSAMFDNDTLVVSYDIQRGEPRGSRQASENYKGKGLGDCIDCRICVQVCPTGIDIRNGLQYQCIGCCACIDACDDVMDKMQYPKGLIRYTTQNAIAGKRSRVLRPRVLIYASVMLVFIALFVYTVMQRIPLELDVIRDRNQLYRETHGLIENVYTLKIINMDALDHYYELSVSGIANLALETRDDRIFVESGAVYDLPVQVRTDEADLVSRSSDIFFNLTAVEDENLRVTEKARFLGPVP